MTRLALACAVLAAAGPQLSAALINYMGGTPNTTNFNPNPNVTAVVPVPGWNLAKPYPGLWVDGENPETAVGQGWTMHLNITANVTSPYGDERKGRVTRQTIELRPPSPPSAGSVFDPQSGEWIVDKNTTDTWAIRLISFTKSKMPPGGRNNKDGSCEGILSKECVDGVTQSLASSPQSQSGNFSNSFLSIGTDKCPFVGWSISYPVALNENFTLEATQLWDDPLSDKDGVYSNAYDFYGSRAIPYVIIWGHSNTTAVGQRLGDRHVTFGCIKADTVVGDSRLPSAAPVGKIGSAGLMWVAISAAMSAVLLV